VRHPGYAVSQWIRKQVEEAFGWMKTIGGLAQDSLSRPRTGADARLPGRRRLQPRAHRPARPVLHMKTGLQTAFGRQRPRAADQHRGDASFPHSENYETE